MRSELENIDWDSIDNLTHISLARSNRTNFLVVSLCGLVEAKLFEIAETQENFDVERIKYDGLMGLKKYLKENRALAFAFVIYNFENPAIAKILRDSDYWNALNKIAGKYLTIFYIHSELQKLNEKKVYFPKDKMGNNFGFLHGFAATGGPSDLEIPVLKKFFDIDEEIKLSSIIFFQIDEQNITDAIIVEIEEDEIEKSFLEIKNTTKEVVGRLKGIKAENYENQNGIFRELKIGINKLNQAKILRKIKAPVFKLISLFT